LFLASMSAPMSRRMSMRPREPFSVALCRGVQPPCDGGAGTASESGDGGSEAWIKGGLRVAESPPLARRWVMARGKAAAE
jgi:hypothetical protein